MSVEAEKVRVQNIIQRILDAKNVEDEKKVSEKRGREEEQQQQQPLTEPRIPRGRDLVMKIVEGKDPEVAKKLKEESKKRSFWGSKASLLDDEVQNLMESMEKSSRAIRDSTNIVPKYGTVEEERERQIESMIWAHYCRMYDMIETLLKEVTEKVLSKHAKLEDFRLLYNSCIRWQEFLLEHSLTMENAAWELRNKNEYMFPRSVKTILWNICDFANRELKN